MNDEREESQVDRAKLRVMVERLQSDLRDLSNAVARVIEGIQEVKDTVAQRFSETFRRLEGHEARIAALEAAHKAGEESKRKWVAMVVNHGFTIATGLLVGWLALKGGCK